MAVNDMHLYRLHRVKAIHFDYNGREASLDWYGFVRWQTKGGKPRSDHINHVPRKMLLKIIHELGAFGQL